MNQQKKTTKMLQFKLDIYQQSMLYLIWTMYQQLDSWKFDVVPSFIVPIFTWCL